MFPLYDETPQLKFPIINYLLIAANIIVFLLQLSVADPEQFIYEYAFIPREFNPFAFESYQYVLTSMFMHGGWFHIISNLWFLKIFGDNVEDAFGHIKYLIFYLLGGLAATLTQYFLDPSSTIPMIGASGAISAVSGAYFVYFRHAKVKTLIIFFGFLTIVNISAWMVLGYWFLSQILSGVVSLSEVQEGGVAFFAHIGGFIFGYLIAKLITPKNSN